MRLKTRKLNGHASLAPSYLFSPSPPHTHQTNLQQSLLHHESHDSRGPWYRLFWEEKEMFKILLCTGAITVGCYIVTMRWSSVWDPCWNVIVVPSQPPLALITSLCHMNTLSHTQYISTLEETALSIGVYSNKKYTLFFSPIPPPKGHIFPKISLFRLKFPRKKIFES